MLAFNLGVVPTRYRDCVKTRAAVSRGQYHHAVAGGFSMRKLSINQVIRPITSGLDRKRRTHPLPLPAQY
jgi:hypothetical protein